MLAMSGIVKRFGANEVLRGVSLSVGARRDRGGDRPQRLGQDHAAALHQHAGGLRGRHRHGGRRAGRLPAGSATGKRQRMSEREIAAAREHIGIVFQSYNLFPHMTALQNIVAAPMRVKGVPRAKAEARARDLLAMVGLSDKADEYPGAAVRRPAAARRDRARAGDGPEDHAVRRGDLGAGSGTGGRGAGGDAAAWRATA